MAKRISTDELQKHINKQYVIEAQEKKKAKKSAP